MSDAAYCEAQVGGMECGAPVAKWGVQCPKHDPEYYAPLISELPFPPPLISKWVSGETVSTELLVAELRKYADYFGGRPS